MLIGIRRKTVIFDQRQHNPLSKDTIDCILRQQEVGPAKDL
jgi:hypothetical protein